MRRSNYAIYFIVHLLLSMLGTTTSIPLHYVHICRYFHNILLIIYTLLGIKLNEMYLNELLYMTIIFFDIGRTTNRTLNICEPRVYQLC